LPTCAPEGFSEEARERKTQGAYEHADEDEVVDDTLQVVAEGKQRGVVLLARLGARLAWRRRGLELGVQVVAQQRNLSARRIYEQP
jgi:hypothetical protein